MGYSGTAPAENDGVATILTKAGEQPITAIPARLLAASFLQPDYLVPLLERARLIRTLG